MTGQRARLNSERPLDTGARNGSTDPPTRTVARSPDALAIAAAGTGASRGTSSLEISFPFEGSPTARIAADTRGGADRVRVWLAGASRPIFAAIVEAVAEALPERA